MSYINKGFTHLPYNTTDFSICLYTYLRRTMTREWKESVVSFLLGFDVVGFMLTCGTGTFN